MVLRGHDPVVLEEFNGLWKRGDEDSCPPDHFIDSNNVQHFESGFETRDGIDTFLAQGDVLRIHNYVMQTGQSLLILDINGDLYHALLDGSNTVYGPILSNPLATDFRIFSWAGRAYITLFATFTDDNGKNYQKGLSGDFLFVYLGDGNPARAAAGDSPTDGGQSALIAYNSTIDGVVGKGIHIIGISASDGGDESGGLGPEGLAIVYAPGDKEINLNNIPLGGAGITERKVYMTQSIDPEDWNPDGDIRNNYTFFLVKTIPDNTTIDTIINIDDASLVTAFVPGGLSTLTNSPMYLENTNTDGFCDLGLHVVGVVYETDTGYLTSPGPEFFAVQSYVNERKSIKVYNIPTSPDSFVIKRHLVSTRAILNFNGNNRQGEFTFQFYFIPDGTIDNNSDTEKEVNYFDADLIEDASHLIDNFSQIPSGVGLAEYHGRLALWTSFDDISLVRFSSPGEPEAFDQVDGFVIVPLDGNPITNGIEFRDVFYSMKQTRTFAINDNGGLPSSWEPIAVDNGIGASVHGIATVLDSQGVNIDFILIIGWPGLYAFTGTYVKPELSWKIEDLWEALDRNTFGNMQIKNDTINKVLYITLPNKQMLYANYDNGLNYKTIKWEPWTFDIETTTIELINTDTLLIGAEQSVP